MRIFLLVLAILVSATSIRAQQTPAADSERVYEIGDVEVLPRPQNAQEFAAALGQAYPAPLRAAGVGGTVHVSFVVGAGGTVEAVRVLSTTDSAFAAPSVQAVSILRFSPAQVGGRAVPVRVEQPIHWRAETPPIAAMESPGAAEGAEREYELRAVDQVPEMQNQRAFQRALMRNYPMVQRDAGIEGMVEVRFRVEEDGSVTRARVVRASDRAFVSPTLQALSVLRFSPGQVDGRPVKVWVQIPISYTVSGAGVSSLPRPGEGTLLGRPGEP